MARKPTAATSSPRAQQFALDVSHAEASPAPAAPPARSDWTRRWAMIRTVLGFCAVMSAWIILAGPDDRLRETALLGLLALGGTVALGYLGFATQDDRNWLVAIGRSLGERAAGKGAGR